MSREDIYDSIQEAIVEMVKDSLSSHFDLKEVIEKEVSKLVSNLISEFIATDGSVRLNIQQIIKETFDENGLDELIADTVNNMKVRGL